MEYSPNRAAEFEFVSRTVAEGGKLLFSYRVHFSDGKTLDFNESITLSEREWQKHLPQDFVDAILEDLHLILGVSYYKLFCPPAFKTDIKLSEEQAAFWNTVYTKGLGEFLFRNNIDGSRVAQFTATDGYQRNGTTLTSDIRKTLIGIGGGKDSVVSLELLNEYERTGFIVETGKENAIARDIAHVADVSLQTTSRTLDPQLLEGVPRSYSGHVPISLVYAFLGVLEAAIGGHAWVVVSNEYSSSIGSIVEDDREVNHQWSKSLECEQLVQKYVHETLTSSVRYFSLLRPFYELRIVKMFTELGERYFHIFSSCNKNFAHDYEGPRWCGECAKCAFAFLMLAAFLDKKQVTDVFGKNLFEDETLLPVYKDLLGFGGAKPFDCVGTFEESQTALKYAEPRWNDTLVVREFSSNAREFPEVMRTQQALAVPSRFRLLGMKTALILGYAREGQTNEKYLKKHYPFIRTDHADQNDGEYYLDAQEDFDIVIKTAGIPSSWVTRQFTTATNMFFAEVPREQIIGVTGSKGKSTISTLIYDMLRADGRNVRLVGNVGVPALSVLLEEGWSTDKLFVFELSSYQLADLDVSPHMAVVSALFPDHLEYHGDAMTYYDAKRNITRFQGGEDILVYQGDTRVEEWIPTTRAQIHTVHPLTVAVDNPALIGEHNKRNVAFASTVARLCDVSDEVIESAVKEFKGLPHRLQYVGKYNGIDFYDDALSGSPETAIAALKAVPNTHAIILGGFDRGLDYSSLEEELRKSSVKVVVLFPDTGESILSSEEGFTVLHTKDMDTAVQFIYEHTPEGTACLLSPAAPSFNLFKSFEERGEKFIEAVKKYGGV